MPAQSASLKLRGSDTPEVCRPQGRCVPDPFRQHRHSARISRAGIRHGDRRGLNLSAR